MAAQIINTAKASMNREQLRLKEQSAALAALATTAAATQKRLIATAQASINKLAQAKLKLSNAYLHSTAIKLANQAATKCKQNAATLQTLNIKTDMGLRSNIAQQQNKLAIIRNTINNNEPRKLLAKGFSIIRKNGKAITNTKQLGNDDIYELEMADGKTTITINKLA